MQTRIARFMFTLAFGNLFFVQPSCLAQGPGALPFQSTYRRPSISAYQQLGNFANNPQLGGNAYQQMVQPLLQQQQTEITQMSDQRKLGQVQNDVRRLKTNNATRMNDAMIRPTGHSATFLNYSHFYPSGR